MLEEKSPYCWEPSSSLHSSIAGVTGLGLAIGIFVGAIGLLCQAQNFGSSAVIFPTVAICGWILAGLGIVFSIYGIVGNIHNTNVLRKQLQSQFGITDLLTGEANTTPIFEWWDKGLTVEVVQEEKLLKKQILVSPSGEIQLFNVLD